MKHDFLLYVIIVLMGTSHFLGPYEMVKGEWKYSIITGGSFGKKWGHFSGYGRMVVVMDMDEHLY